MYNAIVKNQVRRTFRNVENKNYDAIIKDMLPDVHHRFAGDHALGGERHDRDTLRLWFERVGRLLPDIRFTLHEIIVKGMPWNTRIVVRWTENASRPDGTTYTNNGIHFITLRRGRVVSLDVHLDTAAAQGYFDQLRAAGIAEASAAPITS